MQGLLQPLTRISSCPLPQALSALETEIHCTYTNRPAPSDELQNLWAHLVWALTSQPCVVMSHSITQVACTGRNPGQVQRGPAHSLPGNDRSRSACTRRREWLRYRHRRQGAGQHSSSRRWRALALKCHCVSLDTRAFPKKNRGAQIGGAGN